MGNLLFGAGIGFLWGFVIFFNSPAENMAIKKQGAIEVYQGKAKCEQAVGEWVCKVGDFGNGGAHP
ncbi:hypothetical protein ACRPHP_16635 [Pantoea allii]|uniref:hypothetical protein n=1 Tax=Pantoea allii TaxID=574096 RepID=UPI003D797349